MSAEDWISPEYIRHGRDGAGARPGLPGERLGACAAGRPIINETTARHYFGDQDPIGRLIYFPKIDAQNRYLPSRSNLGAGKWQQVIVGVVRDVRDVSLRRPAMKMAFLPLSQRPQSPAAGFGNVAGLGVDPPSRVGQIRMMWRARSAVCFIRFIPASSTCGISMLEADIERTLGSQLMMTRLVGFFGGAGAAAGGPSGLYRRHVYSVARRTGEIGVRRGGGEPGKPTWPA